MNSLNRPLLRVGIGAPNQRLLVVPGRRTGRLHSTPVSVLDHDGERYLVAGFGGGDWVSNVRHAGLARLRHGRIDESVLLVEIDPKEAPALVATFAAKVRGGRAFVTDDHTQHPVFRIVRASP